MKNKVIITMLIMQLGVGSACANCFQVIKNFQPQKYSVEFYVKIQQNTKILAFVKSFQTNFLTELGSMAELPEFYTKFKNEIGIKFKLPHDWEVNDKQVEFKQQNSRTTLDSWISPDLEQMAFFVKTFALEKPTAMIKQQILEESFKQFLPMANKSIYGEIKKLKIGKTDGFIRKIKVDFESSIGKRSGFIWTGYRIYKGNLQEIEIDLNSKPESSEILLKVFSTIMIEED